MKKKILVLAVAIYLSLSATFAHDVNPVPKQIINELNHEFKNGKNVQWKTTSNFYKASFTLDNNPLEAFYSLDGNFIGVSRKLNVDQLPMILIKETNKKGSMNEITDLFELMSDRGTEYYIAFETGKEKKFYRSSGNSWSRYYSREL